MGKSLKPVSSYSFISSFYNDKKNKIKGPSEINQFWIDHLCLIKCFKSASRANILDIQECLASQK